MAFSINTNNAALEALSSLRQTNAALTTTENQVSTGKKVNTAADDPAIYAISQTFSSQVSALSGISTGLQVTAQVISTAQSQATSSASLLATLSQNLTEGQASGLDASSLNQTISKTLSQIDANANGATFKGVNLLSGAVGNGVTSTTATAAQDLNGTLFQQAGFNATSTGLGLAGLNVNQSGIQLGLSAATAANFDGAAGAGATVSLSTTAVAGADGTAQNVANTLKFAINDGTAEATTTSTSYTLSAAIQTALTGNAAATGATVKLNDDGSLSLSGLTAGTGTGATLTKSTNANGDTVYTFGATGDASTTLTASKDASGNFVYSVQTGTDANGNTTKQSTFVSITSKAGDSVQNYTNALSTAIQNQGFGVTKDASGNLDIAGGNLNAATTGTGAAASSVGTATVQSGSAYALSAINAAISSLNTISSALGSSSDELTGLQSTVSTLSDALTSGIGALTDADLSQESAKLTSLQTKQQLAIQSLSIANSQPQSLLSLFR